MRTSDESLLDFCGMPSLIRLLVVLGLIAGVVYGGMIALVVLVEPHQREMSVRVPPERLDPNR